MRLIAELVGARVVAPESLLQLLEGLAARLGDEALALSQRDQYAFLLLGTLPWVMIS